MFTEQELKEFWKVKKSIEWDTIPKPTGEHYTDLQGDCWICTSHAKGSTGRPHINHRSHGEQEHIHISRLMYERAVGDIPAGLDVLHKCDRKDCVNPHHLYLGTDIDNTRDRMERGQQYTPQGEGHGKAKLTNEQVLAIFHDPRQHKLIAEDYGIGRQQVSKIKSGERWGHITQQHK
jgi:hypothetical protein